jgi:hypothetical protein
MEETRPSGSGVRHRKLQPLWTALATFILATLVSLVVFIAYAASRQWLHPAVVFTPFTLHRGNAFEGATDELHLPIFPGSVPIETGTFDQQGDHSGASSNSVGLALVRLLASAPMPTVKNWYEQNFPKPSSELSNQQILNGAAKEAWFQALDVQVDSETVLYRPEDSMAPRGIILQPSKNNDGGTIITAYYLSHGR